jgi:putative transposase
MDSEDSRKRLRACTGEARVRTCIVHLVRASLNYVNWKERKQVAADLKAIYRAATEPQAEQELSEFIAKWEHKYHAIGKRWKENLERVIPLFQFPAEIRRVIYTTNAVESLHMSLRKIIKTRGSLPSEEAALKLLYLALHKILDTTCVGARHRCSSFETDFCDVREPDFQGFAWRLKTYPL